MANSYEYRPKTCQWIGNGAGCSSNVVLGQSYCYTHYSKVFQTISDEDIDLMVDEIEKHLEPIVVPELGE